ncbi:MAG: glycosyltransferase [Chitinivibrionales bacterium]|nr:glycosyltransferase [Chitinivibrionales bacterium]
MTKKLAIGFISFRFAGTDGVSLETEKWANVLEGMGHTCYYFAGELDRPPDRSFLVSEAHFTHPEIRDIYVRCYGDEKRSSAVTRKIMSYKELLKEQLYKFKHEFGIDLFITENALSIPLNIPLSLAITETISETGTYTIGHHHDFYWERKRFMVNSIWEYINMAFPPHIPNVYHVVINSSAANQLSLRTGISSTIVPNIMDFHNPPPAVDKYSEDVREALEIDDDESFILQPTRVVPRKGIEHAIELVSRLGLKSKLIISHASGDEGYDYEKRIREYSQIMNVNTLFVSDVIGEHRSQTEDGRKIYALNDIYPHADLITYPSNFEGFGNAFLEAIYFKKPIVVNDYLIYTIDIKPKGFKVIEMPGYVSTNVIRATRAVVMNKEMRREYVEHNYHLGRKYYSYPVLERKLNALITDCFGI